MKITSPAKDYTGTQTYGETVIEFKDGVANFDGDLPPGVRSYMSGAGYGIGRAKAADPDVAPDPADPRDVENARVGTPLRDAAVDPRPEDFLPPTNAGKAGPMGNPHGPHVVAPQIHAAGDQSVVPGPVGSYDTGEDGELVVVSDTAAQEARETGFAKRALVGNESVPDVLADIASKATPQGVEDGTEPPVEDLKGAALDEALDEAGVAKSGTADEKRARLAEHRAQA